jgi:hypothetical protein
MVSWYVGGMWLVRGLELQLVFREGVRLVRVSDSWR